MGKTNQRYGRVAKEVKKPIRRRRGVEIILLLIWKYFLVRKRSKLVSLIRVRLGKKW